MMRRSLVAGVAAAVVAVVVAVVAGCGIFGRASEQDERFVRPESPKSSPSGEYTAFAEPGPTQNGVRTWVVVIRDSSDQEVFRDDDAYSTRHGVGITWLSGEDQLWILSSDVGTSYVDKAADGTWRKTAITPDTVDDIPDEIDRLRH